MSSISTFARTKHAWLLALSGLIGVACASDEPPAETLVSIDGTHISAPASADTRARFGVTRWSGQVTDTELSARGYDDEGRLRIEMLATDEQRSFTLWRPAADGALERSAWLAQNRSGEPVDQSAGGAALAGEVQRAARQDLLSRSLAPTADPHGGRAGILDDCVRHHDLIAATLASAGAIASCQICMHGIAVGSRWVGSWVYAPLSWQIPVVSLVVALFAAEGWVCMACKSALGIDFLLLGKIALCAHRHVSTGRCGVAGCAPEDVAGSTRSSDPAPGGGATTAPADRAPRDQPPAAPAPGSDAGT
jgi:hypothetical protein